MDAVGGAESIDAVVAAAAEELVVGVGAGDRVRRWGPDPQVSAVGAVEGDPLAPGEGVAGVGVDRVLALPAVDRVDLPVARLDRVVAVTAAERVAAGPAVERVAAGTGADVVAPVAAAQAIIGRQG